MNIKKKALSVAPFAMGMLLMIDRLSTVVYCDAFVEAGKALGNLQDKIVTIANVLFPLAVVICAVLMLITHDQKKFDAEKHILIGCCIAFGLIQLVCNTSMVDTIAGLFSGGGATGAGSGAAGG